MVYTYIPYGISLLYLCSWLMHIYHTFVPAISMVHAPYIVSAIPMVHMYISGIANHTFVSAISTLWQQHSAYPTHGMGKKCFLLHTQYWYYSYTHTTYCIEQGACGYRVRHLPLIFFFEFFFAFTSMSWFIFLFFQGPCSYGVQHLALETSGVMMVALIGPSPRSVLYPKPKPCALNPIP